MPQVIFAPTEGERLAVEAPDGGSLGDLCDEVGAPVTFSCRSATCGSCRVEVLEGADLFVPADADERELLASFARVASTTYRLACQAIMQRGTGRVVLSPSSPFIGAARG